MRLFENPKFNFIHQRKIGYAISGTLVIVSIAAILLQGLQFGIDFRGGTEVVVEFQDDVPPIAEIRTLLTEALESQPELKSFGDDLLIRTDVQMEGQGVARFILATLGEAYPDNPGTVIKSDIVGPRFAEDLRNAAAMAVFIALGIIFVYIFIRFKKWYYSTGAVLALAHDVIVTLGIFTILYEIVPFSLDIDQAIIGAFLMIVGYSLNDTVVVFDRIRENSLIFKTEAYPDMVNRSINNTLSRTVVTSMTTLIVVLILFLFGGEVLKGLSFALILGVLLGTYSSIFVASAVLVDLQLKRANK